MNPSQSLFLQWFGGGVGRSERGRISFNFVSLIKACRAKASPKPVLQSTAAARCLRSQAPCADIAPPLVRWCSESGRWAAGQSSAVPAVTTSSFRGSRSLRCASGGRRALFLTFVPQSRPVAPSSVRSAEREAAAPKFLLRRGKAVASLSAALCAFFRGENEVRKSSDESTPRL